MIAASGWYDADIVRWMAIRGRGRRTEMANFARTRGPEETSWPTLDYDGKTYALSFARDVGLEPRTTPLESPQSNGMAEAFVRTIKRDYVRVSPRPDAETVMLA
jgi:transposase InsO family protein